MKKHPEYVSHFALLPAANHNVACSSTFCWNFTFWYHKENLINYSYWFDENVQQFLHMLIRICIPFSCHSYSFSLEAHKFLWVPGKLPLSSYLSSFQKLRALSLLLCWNSSSPNFLTSLSKRLMCVGQRSARL